MGVLFTSITITDPTDGNSAQFGGMLEGRMACREAEGISRLFRL